MGIKTGIIRLVIVLVIACSTAVRAGPIEDLTDRVNAIETRVTSLESNVSSLDTKVQGLGVDVGSLDVKVTGIQGDISGLRSDIQDLDDTFSGLAPIIEIINAQLTMLGDNPELLDMLDTAAQQALAATDTVVRQLPDELGVEDLQTFLGVGGNCGDGSTCADTRLRLAALLEQLAELVNAMGELEPGVVPDINIEPLHFVLDNVPGAALYGPYVLMQAGPNLLSAEFLQRLQTAVTDLRLTIEVISPGGFGVMAAGNLLSCQSVFDNRELRGELAVATAKIGIMIKGLGDLVAASSQLTVVNPTGRPVKLGIHGYLGFHIKNDPASMVGQLLSALGGALVDVGRVVTNRIRFCTIEIRQLDILDGLVRLEGKVDDLLEPGNSNGCENQGRGSPPDCEEEN